MLFSTDVETTGLVPGVGDNRLVSIGIVPVTEDGDILAGADPKDSLAFYRKIDVPLRACWWDFDLPPESDTHSWWRKQDPAVYHETFFAGERESELAVAERLFCYVKDLEPDADKRFFVANPVSFDKPWIDHLFASTGIANPFHYRSLCLRSMRFGLDETQLNFGWHRDTEPSLYPHHAYYDAYSQAKDLRNMLLRKIGKVEMVNSIYD